MAQWKSRVGQLALVLAATIISGCPVSVVTPPQLSATPAATDFGTTQTTRDIALANSGGGTLNWTAQEVTRTDVDSPWVPADIPWLTLSASAGSITTELNHITLTASRSGLPAGLFTNSGVQISSNGGTVTIPVSLTVESQLQVTPTALSLSAAATSASFTVTNRGVAPLNWSVSFLADPANRESGIPLPAGFTASPVNATTQALASTAVTVTFPAGSSNFALLVNSNSGQEVVRFAIGAALTQLNITPATLTLSIGSGAQAGAEQPASVLRLENAGNQPVSWTINTVDRINPNAVPPIAVAPVLGTTQVGQTSQVEVRVSNPNTIIQGDGLYELVVRVGDAFQVVPIIVDVLPLPEITLSLPPQTEFLQPPVVETRLLDFSDDLVQLQFFVVNTGSRDSSLFFQISYDQQGQDDALIADVSPIRGDTNGSDRDFFLFDQQVYTDGAPISVTINRNNLREDLATRTITVRAFESGNFVSELTSVAAKTIQVRVSKPPFTVTGALNRARAPSMLRFVFSNRDEQGQIVPLQTEADRERLSYDIFEDRVPLDLNETSQFLSFDYRGNVVLILDFTGSMYHAGTTGPNPLQPGEAVNFMREAAKSFIDDLPPNFRLQLMFHTDRIPENRIIQRFTSDRAQLREALDRFTVAPALFGDSDIVATLEMAMDSLVAEDPSGTLPFDDADVRAVVFITDGKETVRGSTIAGLENKAEETRTRLFPVAYSPNGDVAPLADLIVAAESSGGHLYTASSVANLPAVLGTRSTMEVVAATTDAPNRARFIIRNIGNTPFTYSVTTPNLPWIGGVSVPNGSVNGGASQAIDVTLVSTGIAPGTRLEATLNVTASNGGTAEVVVQFTTTNTNAASIRTAVRDETGTIWHELNNQAVLTYITPKQVPFEYLLSGVYRLPDNTVIEGPFQRNGVFVLGDPRIGQVSLRTAGIIEDLTTLNPALRYRAEIFVYADYVPRNIFSFAFRFMPTAAADLPAGSQALLDNATMTVERAAGGLLDDGSGFGTSEWRLIAESDGRVRIFTDDDNALPVGSFGNLLKITFTNLFDYVNAFGAGARQPEFFLGMRMDNRDYISTQSEGQPSSTKYFIYPGGIVNDERLLAITLGQSDLAGPTQFVEFLSEIPGFNPEGPDALDLDGDGIPDFNDPAPADGGLPATRVVPNPVDVGSAQTTFTVTIRNNLLDSFDWNVATNDPDFPLPSWIPAAQIRYGVNAQSATPIRPTLAPGETERVHFTVDRTGLTPGTIVTDAILFDISNREYAFIVPELVSVTVEIAP